MNDELTIDESDEFYTMLSNIENEVRHHKTLQKQGVVLCNCDDPRVSNFFHYFSYNFELQNQSADLFSEHNLIKLFTENTLVTGFKKRVTNYNKD